MPKKKSGSSPPSNKAKADSKAQKELKPQGKKDAGKRPPRTAKKSSSPELYFPVVGIGASAGGLEAFTQENLPRDTS